MRRSQILLREREDVTELDQGGREKEREKKIKPKTNFSATSLLRKGKFLHVKDKYTL